MISVIIAMRNAQKTIAACLDSILNQTYQNFEIIIIDDQSNDQSIQIVERYMHDRHQIKLYQQRTHLGASACRNIGVDKASGEYLSFIDSDDTVEPTFLEEMSKLIKSSQLVCCGYREISPSTTRELEIVPTQDPLANLLRNYQGFVANKLYHKSIITKQSIKFDSTISMCEDLLFNIQYVSHCQKISFVNQNLYNYIIATNSSSRNFNQKWFDILTVYNIVYQNSLNFTQAAQDIIALHYLYSLAEARMRCRIMGLKYHYILSQHLAESSILDSSKYKQVMKSKFITTKEKMRLFIFTKFNYLSQLIKFKGAHV